MSQVGHVLWHGCTARVTCGVQHAAAGVLRFSLPRVAQTSHKSVHEGRAKFCASAVEGRARTLHEGRAAVAGCLPEGAGCLPEGGFITAGSPKFGKIHPVRSSTEFPQVPPSSSQAFPSSFKFLQVLPGSFEFPRVPPSWLKLPQHTLSNQI